jgi:diacylglycerol kinase
MTLDPVPRPSSLAPSDRSWSRKFRDAFRGVREGVRGQSSFFVHFFAAAVVIAAGFVLGINHIEWCLLMLCIAGVLTAEMFNSALESMAKAITGEGHPHLGNSLDIGSAAVLTASVGAAVVGCIIFGHRLGLLFGWW